MTKQEILDNKHVLRVEHLGNVIRVILKKGWYLISDDPRDLRIRHCNTILFPQGNLRRDYRVRFASKKEVDALKNNDNDNDNGNANNNFSPRRSRRIRSAKS